MTPAFISQSALDIKRKLQKLGHLREKSIRDLVKVSEKVYNGRDSAEEKEIEREQCKNQHPASVLLATTAEPEERQLAKPLHEVTKEGQDFIWTKEHQLAFEKLKACSQPWHWVCQM